MRTLLIALLMLAPSLAMAAYQNPTVISNQRQANGTVVVTFAFTGDAGEPTVTRPYTVTGLTTRNAVRTWVDETITELDRVRTAETIADLQPGQTVTRVSRVNPVKAAKQAWREKFELYLRIKDSGVAAIASYVAALKADIEATYQAGYLDE